MLKILVVFFLMTSTFPLSAIGPPLMLEHEEEETYEESEEGFDWITNGTYELPYSHSSLTIPKDHMLLMGEEAKRFETLCRGWDEENIEAVLADETFENVIYFSYFKEGYVVNDWTEIDPDVLIEIMRENVEKENEQREEGDAIYVKGWIQEPTLGRYSNTALWLINVLYEDGDDVVNAIALKFGKEGYEKLFSISEKGAYKPVGGTLDLVLRSYNYNQGFRYKDYSRGDKIAEYEMTELIAATIGAELADETVEKPIEKQISSPLLIFKTCSGLIFLCSFIFLCKKNYLIKK